MKTSWQAITLLALFGVLLSGCPDSNRQTRPFELTTGQLTPVWAISRDQELGCGGSEIAGGESSGEGNFAELGRLTINVSVAWNIGNLLTQTQFVPTGPAGGPAAPVLGQNDYPYHFRFNPLTGGCTGAGETGMSATGQVLFTADDGDQLFGLVTGGETHRLDFVVEGDGAESFITVEFNGGTGDFSGATGSFTTHSITRFDAGLGAFVIDLFEVLPGGTITF